MEEVRRLLGLGQSAFEGGRPKRSGKALCDYVQAHRKLWTTLLTGGAASAMRQEFMRAAEEIAASGPRANPWIPIDLAVPFVTSAIFDADQALVARGVDQITLKPSQFIDDPKQMPSFLREVDRRIEALL